MKRNRLGVLLVWGVLVCLCGCESGTPRRSVSPRPGEIAKAKEPPGLPTYEGFARGEWSIEALKVPVATLLSIGQAPDTDSETSWGAAEVVLSTDELRTADRDKAFAVMESLVTRQPENETYAVRTLCHYLRWPDKYREHARRLAQSRSASDNALISYSLAACALATKDDAGAREMLLAARDKERFTAYELETLRARVKALQKAGYSRFSALAFGFFQRKVPHIRWLSAITLHYDGKFGVEFNKGATSEDYEAAEGVLNALLAMAERGHANAASIESELATLNMGKRTLMRIVDLRGRMGNPVGVRYVQQYIKDVDARKTLMEEYLARRNAAFAPRGPQKKSEEEWIRFFDAVLESGEVEAIRNDRMIEGTAPLTTIHLAPRKTP